MATGIPLADFIEASVTAYKKGFNDAIQCLMAAEKTINEEAMRTSIKEILEKQGVTKNDW